jgi:hypoxanthine phosphoribosyltransferase
MNKLVIKQHELNGLVAKLCRDIVLSGWRPDYIVGLTRGGLVPAVMISHYLNVPMYRTKREPERQRYGSRIKSMDG